MRRKMKKRLIYLLIAGSFLFPQSHVWSQEKDLTGSSFGLFAEPETDTKKQDGSALQSSGLFDENSEDPTLYASPGGPALGIDTPVNEGGIILLILSCIYIFYRKLKKSSANL